MPAPASMVATCLQDIWAKPVGQRTRFYMEKVLAGHHSGDKNPASLTMLRSTVCTVELKGKKHRTQSHPSMPWQDVPAFMQRLDPNTTSHRAVAFTVLTGARASETRGAKWAEIDLRHKTWTIPAKRMEH